MRKSPVRKQRRNGAGNISLLMPRKRPKLCIITASYNAQYTLESCIRSVSWQNVDLEHVLIDGSSTDQSYQVIERHRNKFSTIISEPDSGIYEAMNKGIRVSRGEIIGFLNADDFYPENNILESVSRAFEDPEVDACYGDLLYVEKENISKINRYWKSGNYSRHKFYQGWMPPHPTFFVRRSVYEKYGLFRQDMGSAADYELMLRFLLINRINTVYVPRIMVHMRTEGASNVSMANRIAANRMDRKAWKVNQVKPLPWTLTAKPLLKLGQWVSTPPLLQQPSRAIGKSAPHHGARPGVSERAAE